MKRYILVALSVTLGMVGCGPTDNGTSGASSGTGASLASTSSSSYVASLIRGWSASDSSCAAFGALECDGRCDYHCGTHTTCRIPGLSDDDQNPGDRDTLQDCYGPQVSISTVPGFDSSKDGDCAAFGALSCKGKCSYYCNSATCKVPGLPVADGQTGAFSYGSQNCGSNQNIQFPPQ